MLGKLAFRNVKRSAKDYLVYVITMTFVTALMFAFNSILFSPDIRKRIDAAEIMIGMVGMATFFIVIIVAWLINYMVRFMLEKRSREFGTYLLLGMRKKEISRLYMRENILLGIGAFLVGMVLGVLLQQILLSVLYIMIRTNYHFHLEFNKWCLLMTVCCYAGCYLLALLRCKRKFKKMNIRDLMDAGNKNEEIKESHEKIKKWLLPLSLIFLLMFGLWLFFGGLLGEWNAGTIIAFLVGLILVIYLFYVGLASWIICYIRKGGRKIYKGQNLFLFRQLSSKIKTMRFTMGTITALFMVAFLGCTFAMMFSDYQNKILEDKFPFDVQVYSSDVKDDFEKELTVIRDVAEIKDTYSYHIYENGTNQVNVWLFTHLREFGTMYLKDDGSVDRKKIENDETGCYCKYDTYMKLSDYNYLRKMLGYKEVSLKENEYVIHIKKRVLGETGDFSNHLTVQGKDTKLKFAGYYTETFSQDGHNGGDYVIVVPDSVSDTLNPYYSELAVDIKGKAPNDLDNRLDSLEKSDESLYQEIAEDEDGGSCSGSDAIVSYSAANLVRDNVIPEVKYMLSSLIFPCFYIGIVFVCVALTVLAVQQLSDSAKYKFRYGVLKKMGLNKKEIAGVIRKQLVAYYLCPALFAAVIAGVIAIYTSRKFIFYTGLHTAVLQYFGISFTLFFGIYLLYFIATYVGFKRNVESEI